MQCTKLKADFLEEVAPPQVAPPQAEPQVGSAVVHLRPVAVPPAILWREFRVQILPWLTFGGALALALLLWQKAVVPLPAGPPPDPPASLGEDREAISSVTIPPGHQILDGTTNGIAKAPNLKD